MHGDVYCTVASSRPTEHRTEIGGDTRLIRLHPFFRDEADAAPDAGRVGVWRARYFLARHVASTLTLGHSLLATMTSPLCL